METEGEHTWRVKYYKGLGTSTAKEAKEYFSDMDLHRIPFKYAGPEDDDAILLVRTMGSLTTCGSPICVEIECYSVACLDRVTAFKAPCL